MTVLINILSVGIILGALYCVTKAISASKDYEEYYKNNRKQY